MFRVVVLLGSGVCREAESWEIDHILFLKHTRVLESLLVFIPTKYVRNLLLNGFMLNENNM